MRLDTASGGWSSGDDSSYKPPSFLKFVRWVAAATIVLSILFWLSFTAVTVAKKPLVGWPRLRVAKISETWAAWWWHLVALARLRRLTYFVSSITASTVAKKLLGCCNWMRLKRLRLVRLRVDIFGIWRLWLSKLFCWQLGLLGVTRSSAADCEPFGSPALKTVNCYTNFDKTRI